uniref:Cyclin C-terminal domain-containing protein n=1 Tax=Oryza nivara TaxID=4536 RepID=A0A0E0FJ45_ORYNI
MSPHPAAAGRPGCGCGGGGGGGEGGARIGGWRGGEERRHRLNLRGRARAWGGGGGGRRRVEKRRGEAVVEAVVSWAGEMAKRRRCSREAPVSGVRPAAARLLRRPKAQKLNLAASAAPVKKGSLASGRNVGTNRASAVKSASAKPAPAISRHESATQKESVLPPKVPSIVPTAALAPVTVPCSSFVSPMHSGDSVSVDETMSTCDSMKSPEFEYIDNGDSSSVLGSLQRRANENLCISEDRDVEETKWKKDAPSPMEIDQICDLFIVQDPALHLEFLANYVAELSLLEYNLLSYPPSLVAASAIFLAKFILQPAKHPWNSTLAHYTQYKSSELSDCVKALHRLFCVGPGSNLPAIREKYTQHKYKFVAKKPCPPSIPTEFFRDSTC